MQNLFRRSLSRGSQSCSEESLWSNSLLSQVVRPSSRTPSSRVNTPQFSELEDESETPIRRKDSFSSLAVLIDCRKSRNSSLRFLGSVAALSSHCDQDFDDIELGIINGGFQRDTIHWKPQQLEVDCESQNLEDATAQINHSRIPRNLICPIGNIEKETESFSDIAFKVSEHADFESVGTGLGDLREKMPEEKNRGRRGVGIVKEKMKRGPKLGKRGKTDRKIRTRVAKRIRS